jgi:hypothetical protein
MNQAAIIITKMGAPCRALWIAAFVLIAAR